MSDLQPVTTVLAQRTIYETPGVFSPNQGIVSALINFPTLNEDLVIQRIIQDHQAKKAQENSLWRIGGGLYRSVPRTRGRFPSWGFNWGCCRFWSRRRYQQ
ncbi:hypothetical protein [Synechocystis salina]|uniref:Uncharacterized protein n=1 Tax=Synechocystis salina LEGE 00031 TaxID=1828736 RepID=A0ABR9VZG7_9SYNC|nr:hypothetical protein [Synechocystis salina]MBE9242664.1 hypothetical protein [Synechocystis salina LEGE 00041]MBE9255788.1 hypothetical protein [Synechocystis salina LEGE 00031]